MPIRLVSCSLFVLLIPCLVGCTQNEVQEVTLSSEQAAQVRNAPAIEFSPDDWPCWRGADGDNHATGKLPPISWSEQHNIVWKTSVPGRGHSSPIVCGDKVLLTTADETNEKQSVLCFDRASGDQLWQTVVHEGKFETDMHSDNSHASPTPAFDGERVFAVFLNNKAIWATACDLNGEQLWQTRLGDFNSRHGYGSSPVLYKSVVIVAADCSGGGFLAALDRKTGDVAWRVKRASDDSFGTPIIANVAGRTQLLLSGLETVVSYDPVDGRELWRADGTADTTANTMAWSGDLVFGSGGYPQHNIMAFRADGSGEVVWERSERLYVSSPLVIGDGLFCVLDSRAFTLDTKTGEATSQLRLGGSFYASPTLAGGHIFIPNKTGTTYVLSVDPESEIVAENQLSEGCFASPVICGGRIYLRTYGHLYCIGQPAA